MLITDSQGNQWKVVNGRALTVVLEQQNWKRFRGVEHRISWWHWLLGVLG